MKLLRIVKSEWRELFYSGIKKFSRGMKVVEKKRAEEIDSYYTIFL